MNKSRLGFLLLSIACLLPFVAGSLRGSESDGEDSLYKYLSVFTEVLSLVQRVYVEETTVDGLLAGALDGATDALDPLAVFVPPEGVETFEEARRLAGRRSGLRLGKERGIVFVATVAAGGPGAEAGLRAGDVITQIGDVSTRRAPLWRLHELLAGEPGAVLELDVLRQGQTVEVDLSLGELAPPLPEIRRLDGLPVLAVWRYDDLGRAAVARQLAALAAAGETRLLLDLRGSLEERAETGFDLARLFATGDLGDLRRRGEVIEEYTSEQAPAWSGDLVVLVDRGTLGAPEVAAAVLRQRAGARLVGEATFGHAGRQRAIDLDGGGRLLLTDAFFSGPDGELLSARTEPDELVRETSRGFGEQETPLDELILRRGLEMLARESLEEVA